MKGADTNLIIRFLVKDDEQQARKVKKILDSGEILFVNAVVLTEIYWVLIHVYGYSKNEFIMAIDALLELGSIRFFNNHVVRNALADYIHSTADFSDCLIHQINIHDGFTTLTFDRKVSRLSEMHLLS